MNDKKECELCFKKRPLFKAKINIFSKGWSEEIVMACETCIKTEELEKIVEPKTTKKSKSKKV